ncbi:MAG: hypothetical protein KVP17_004986 [Porospora cf. gigantea B]|uniref:uncharacterized protein n=1 Tax=Porospora cf. gigantea B TaxID=2853592 RepID=UPI003571A57B|nr:MAG: hypothetical protein KVP17_004986 [Porospora cf. gigantea B]
MPHSFGRRARTRQKFRKQFRKHGMPAPSKSMHVYRRGDFVDVIVDSAIHKGMPYHFYHGRTGKVFDVSARSLGIYFKKRVRQRQILKAIRVRFEHVRHSRCREDFLKRAKEHREALAQGIAHEAKRVPIGPKEGEFVKADDVVVFEPQPFVANIY